MRCLRAPSRGSTGPSASSRPEFVVEAMPIRQSGCRALARVSERCARRAAWAAPSGSRPGSRYPRLMPAGLDELPKVGAPAARALQGAGLTTLRQVADVPREELAKLHGVGPKALRIIDEALAEHGLKLR
jgi:predicted flap endonuclease-1-like 5' DNA nuclease